MSEYKKLNARWEGFTTQAQKMTFIKNFAASLSAARERLDDKNPTAHDPTGGATHWVSPVGLPKYVQGKTGSDRYARDYDTAMKRAFPKWAVSNDSNEAKLAQQKKSAILNGDYMEKILPGIPGVEFLFYTGVKYKKQ